MPGPGGRVHKPGNVRRRERRERDRKKALDRKKNVLGKYFRSIPSTSQVIPVEQASKDAVNTAAGSASSQHEDRRTDESESDMDVSSVEDDRSMPELQTESGGKER